MLAYYSDGTAWWLTCRQESNFYYMTGCDIPGSRLIATCSGKGEDLDINLTLLIPEVCMH